MTLAYTQDFKNYDHLIGANVRGSSYQVIGTIVRIEYAVDKWRHHNATAILDNGKRICCRSFGRSK